MSSSGIFTTGASSGNAAAFGHPFVWNIEPITGDIVISYLGARRRFSSLGLESDVLAWCRQIYQLKGQSHGVLGQAASQNPSHSPLAQSGGGGGVGPSTGYYFGPQHSPLAPLRQFTSTKNGGGGVGQVPPVAPQEKPKPLKTEVIKIGEIIAWRGWKVTPQGFLRSMTADVIWAPGEPMQGKTKSVEEHNGCYAYKTARDFLKNHETTGLDIYGKVALWGDVIEHELGYRAEFAQIISLEHFMRLPAPSNLNIKDLRNRYCPRAA